MNNTIRNFIGVVAVIIFVTPALSRAADQGMDVMIIDAVNAKATVVNVNKSDHSLILKDEQGEEFPLVVGDEVRNFDQIKKGDIIDVKYHRAAVSSLQKIEDVDYGNETKEVKRAPKGAKPGMEMQNTSTIVAEVIAIDKKQRLLTLRGPRGGDGVTVEVPPDVKAFDALKKGDKVSAIYTEALAISVTSPTK